MSMSSYAGFILGFMTVRLILIFAMPKLGAKHTPLAAAVDFIAMLPIVGRVMGAW